MNTEDRIEFAVKDVLEEIGSYAVDRKKKNANEKATDWRKEIWKDSTGTKEILNGLIDLAHRENYKAAARKNKSDNADCSECLYDLLWYKGRVGELEEVLLVAEVEWATHASKENRIYKILYDFEKLMVARTKYKVMIFEGYSDFIGETFTKLKDSVRNFKQTNNGDRYLFSGWSWDKQVFEFDHLII